MKRRYKLVFGVILVSLLTLHARGQELVIEGGRLFDGLGDELRDNRRLVIAGGKFAELDAAEAPEGVDARAEVRHLGPYRLASKFFSYAAEPVELPRSVVAGSVSTLRVSLTNRGRRPWASQADVPIHLARKTRPAARSDDNADTIRFTAIDGTVGRRERLELRAEHRWPKRPGRYRLELDLAVGGVELFQEWLGAPIAEGVVEVVAPAAEETAVVTSE